MTAICTFYDQKLFPLDLHTLCKLLSDTVIALIFETFLFICERPGHLFICKGVAFRSAYLVSALEKGAVAYLEGRARIAEDAAAVLKCRVDEVPERIGALNQTLRATEQKLKAALTGGSSDAIGHAIEAAEDLGSYKLVVAQLEGLEAADLRNVWDTVRQKVQGPVACVLATVTSKGQPALLAGATDEAVAAGFKAGDIIKKIAPLVGGGGGGRPQMAQAGGKDATGIPAALEAARSALDA